VLLAVREGRNEAFASQASLHCAIESQSMAASANMDNLRKQVVKSSQKFERSQQKELETLRKFLDQNISKSIRELQLSVSTNLNDNGKALCSLSGTIHEVLSEMSKRNNHLVNMNDQYIENSHRGRAGHAIAGDALIRANHDIGDIDWAYAGLVAKAI